MTDTKGTVVLNAVLWVNVSSVGSLVRAHSDVAPVNQKRSTFFDFKHFITVELSATGQ